jgi:hypothetical protein
MKTYRTFALCKLAHPERDVYQDINCNLFAPKSYGESWIKRRPEDYLMSMEEFLNNGYKLTDGDYFMNTSGIVVSVPEPDSYSYNAPSPLDCRRYILKAKDLELCTSHGIARIQSASGHIEPIECEPVEQVLRRLSTEIDRALQSTSMSSGIRSELKCTMELLRNEATLQHAYSLHCEFYGDDAAEFCAFEDDIGGRSLWLHFAKKLQEQE